MVDIGIHTRKAVSLNLAAAEIGSSQWVTLELTVGDERHEITVFFRDRGAMGAFLGTMINDAQIALADFRSASEVVPAVNDPYSPAYEPA
jgi:hypothetical protein